MNSSPFVIDIDYAQLYKHGQRIGGDVFLLSRNEQKDRVVCTLSDGLGSGVKANVLASLTSNMAQKLSFSPLNAVRSAQIIMRTLPVCKERKISYSTFSILRIELQKDGIEAGLIEYDNPAALLFEQDRPVPIVRRRLELERTRDGRAELISLSECTLGNQSRLVLFTDGVTQAGLGSRAYPLGWREAPVREHIENVLRQDPLIGSKQLAEAIIQKALRLDEGIARDDITCAVITVRRPKDLIIATGPPIDPASDARMAELVMSFSGRKVVSGGTTAQILSRQTNEEVTVDLKSWSKTIPPVSRMKGVDLVTEGMLTLNAVAIELERRSDPSLMPNDAVRKYLELLRSSDRVHFLVGTKINEAHQDPNIPFEIGIRRTIIGRIRRALEDIYLKETSLEYI